MFAMLSHATLVRFKPLIKQMTVKTNTVMTVCRNAFHNGAMACTCYRFMKVLFT